MDINFHLLQKTRKGDIILEGKETRVLTSIQLKGGKKRKITFRKGETNTNISLYPIKKKQGR